MTRLDAANRQYMLTACVADMSQYGEPTPETPVAAHRRDTVFM